MRSSKRSNMADLRGVSWHGMIIANKKPCGLYKWPFVASSMTSSPTPPCNKSEVKNVP